MMRTFGVLVFNKQALTYQAPLLCTQSILLRKRGWTDGIPEHDLARSGGCGSGHQLAMRRLSPMS